MAESTQKQCIDQSCNDNIPSSGLDIYHAISKIQSNYCQNEDVPKLHKLCSYILTSMESDHPKMWYVSVALDKDHSVNWMKQVKWLLLTISKTLTNLKPGMPKDDQLIQVFLSVDVLLCDYSLWKLSQKGGDALKPVLCKMSLSFVEYLIENDLFDFLHELLLNGLSHPRIKFTKHTLPAAMGLRMLALTGFTDKYLCLFISQILTVPAALWHLNHLSTDAFNNLKKFDIYLRCIKLLEKENILEKKSRTEILAVFGNLLQLRRLHPLEQENINLLKVLMSLLSLLKQDDKTQSYAAIWHLMFGWTHKMIDRRLLDCLPHLRLQLNQLWDVSLIKELYSPLLALQWTPPHLQKKKGSSIRNIFVQPPRVMTDEEMKMVYISSHFYSDCLLQLPQMSMDILIGLSASGDLPSKLWLFISQVLRLDVKSFVHHYKTKSQLVHVVSLMCQSICCLLSILDDIELYEAQKHIPMEELIKLTTFLNSLLYSCIWEEFVLVTDDQVIQSSMMLLTLLLQRNQRRNFILEDILLMKNFKSGRFLSEWKAFTPRALSLLQHIPHVIPHPKRVEIFYEYIKADKAELGIGSGRSHVSASYITIHRNRLLEDGYEQLSSLSTANAKGVIRVKFINEQGLDEAGIDELGVFKEFLEEIIKQAFDSSLGLFKRNSDGCLYPSPTSECHSNHLAIFEFVGKILAKAVYEGIVIDLPFAMFFLHQMIKQFHNSLYSSLDELHSLDPELSKSLHFIKHYDGDMEDLCLTFSFEEEFLGKMVTHELIPGGSGISVTADNRISYVHRLAHYKLTTQIKHQMEAFMKGFHSIVNPKWITIFSPQEFQRVISGDGSDYNIDDLRKTTQYYGGYHDKHRVIGWLWDVLKNDFNSNERAAFLKFVTSCSRQPLLGFSSLDPPFSIRRVDSSFEEEAIHVGNSIRTLFGIRSGQKERLPTSSTCFNLLKLPDYGKKSLLKEKLIFSISANAGFELS